MPSDGKPEKGTLDLFAPRPAARAAAPVVPAAVQQPPAPARPAPVARTAIAAQHPVAASPAAVQQPEPRAAPPEGPRTYQVSEIVRFASRALEARFPDVWVEGEISNLRVPGHVYFTLKDAEGQLPAVMFRSQAQRLRFRPADGLKVRARGRLAIYPEQGKLQLYVEALEPAGLGALQLAFEQLKRKLAAEGLFDEARKRRLPFLPRRIGVATSPTGAAVRDIIRVALARGPVRLLLAPCLVQGDEAPADIVRALAALQKQRDVDLVIVGRGGGSAEDLAAFNDERVARAIAACRVPVISAVGHEVDFTIADFVADRRAATPSQAAELAVPVHRELVEGLDDLSTRLVRAARRRVAEAGVGLDGESEALARALQRRLERERRRLGQLEARLRAQHPSARLARDRALLAGLARRLERPLPDRLARAHRALDPLGRRLDAAMQQAIARRRDALDPVSRRLDAAMQQRLVADRHALAEAAARLHALSPLRVLDRGYGLVLGAAGHVLTRAEDAAPGERITVRFARGSLSATVERVGGGGDGGEDEA